MIFTVLDHYQEIGFNFRIGEFLSPFVLRTCFWLAPCALPFLALLLSLFYDPSISIINISLTNSTFISLLLRSLELLP